MVRCSICRLHFSNIKTLNIHYHKHSKSRLIKNLLKFSILLTIPNIFRKRCKEKLTKAENKEEKMNKQLLKTKTLYLNDNFHILCSQNEVIIGDDQNRFSTLFSFDISPQPKVKNQVPQLRSKTKKSMSNTSQQRCHSDYCSKSSASSDGSTNSLKIKQKLKRKKPLRRHYHINISKMPNTQSLDDQTGTFYTCNCRSKNKISKSVKRADLKIITSDTESCSDNGKNLFHSTNAKFFCTKCGNGYKTKSELSEHMYIHETFCRLCNTGFPSKFKFREHMRLHIFKVYLCHMCNSEFPLKEMFYKHFESHMEDKTLESVLDMEQDYRILRYNFVNMNYNSSISNILYYLNEYPEMNYYAYRFVKINCDICRNEVMICDYERHLQTSHSNFFY